MLVLPAKAYDRQVRLAGGDVFERLPDVTFPQHGVQGPVRRQRVQILRRQIENPRGARHTYMKALRGPLAASQTLDGRHLVEDTAGVLHEAHARRGGPHAAVGALKQRKAQLLLQLMEDPAQTGLRHIQVRRRLGD